VESATKEQNCFINWSNLKLNVPETFIAVGDVKSRDSSEKVMYGHVKIHMKMKQYFLAGSAVTDVFS
jgi:hypothetical protein